MTPSPNDRNEDAPADSPPSKLDRLTREIEPLPEGRSLPRSGCYVFIALGIVLTMLTLWGGYTMLRQDQAIGRFTTDEARPAPVAQVPDQAAADELEKRFLDFAAGRSDTFEIAVEELNQAIATFGPLELYRGLIHFKSTNVERRSLNADVSLTLNQARFWRGQRHLNGWIDFQPSATDGGLALQAIDVVVPDREVDPGFVRSFGTMDWLGGFRSADHPEAKAFIERAHTVEVLPGAVRVTAKVQ